jgi:HEAT repeat protein
MHYHKTIEDEQEKEWAFETLVSKGSAVIPAVRRYLISADSISWPLRLLQKVADRQEEVAALEEVLARHEPGYERDPTKKMQLLNHLGALKHEKAAPLVVPYLKDMDEGVRFTAVEALLRQKREDLAREPLLELFVSDEEESLRIRLRISEGFADLGWLVHGHRGGLDREGHIKRKPQS